MNYTWFLRMARWARRPPSMMHVRIVLGAVALCLLIVGIEHFVGWPQALRVDGGGRLRVPRF